MKTNSEIKNMMGLSQHEMANLLGITRSQWGMYEIGERSIPLESIKILAEVVGHVQNAKQEGGLKEVFAKAEKHKEYEWLQREHATQGYQLELLQRKITAMENARHKYFQALVVLEYLEQFPENIVFAATALDIRERVEASLHKNSSHKLLELYLKKETTEMLKNSLAQKLEMISK